MLVFVYNPIQNLDEFEAYCNKRGLTVYGLAEIPFDGYYAQVLKGTANIHHFSQVHLNKAHWLNGQGPVEGRYEWVRLSLKDIDNAAILNSK